MQLLDLRCQIFDCGKKYPSRVAVKIGERGIVEMKSHALLEGSLLDSPKCYR